MSNKNRILKALGLENLAQTIKGLVDTRVELFKHELKGELSKSLAKLIGGLVVALLSLSALLFLSLALSLYLGSLMNSYSLGFLVVGGIYLFLILILILFNRLLGIEQMIERQLKSVLGVEEEEQA